MRTVGDAHVLDVRTSVTQSCHPLILDVPAALDVDDLQLRTEPREVVQGLISNVKTSLEVILSLYLDCHLTLPLI